MSAMSGDTQERQHRASNPRASAWVSANAGSGKTYVLTQRVVRLLLDGVPPSKILCLTFTKAAAANMSMRVFRTLADWTRLDDAALAAALAKMGLERPDASMLVRARRLFARTVETPGGLKIQTIHAFCERLLHLFPFEANVAAGFEVIDDRRRADLLSAARERVLMEAVRDRDGALGRALRDLAEEAGAGDFDKVLREAMGHRRLVLRALRSDPTGARYAAELRRAFGLGPEETEADIARAILEDGIAPGEWLDLAALLETGSANDKKAAVKLRAAANATAGDEKRSNYIGFFLTDELTPRAKIVTKAISDSRPDLVARFAAEQNRLLGLLERHKAAALVARSRALVIVAGAIFAGYEDAKRRRGLLDFDDLVERTSNLLQKADAAWVLFKLDAGIDHILVDEAQDTSPEQWEILAKLAEDFLSGASARTLARTFFAVGDEKQSIYSFQGAEPRKFGEMLRLFERRHREAERLFEPVVLNMSFRSSTGVLKAVDDVFGIGAHARGVTFDNVVPTHEAFHDTLPGLVEIWPLEKPQALEEPRDWRLPLDRLDVQDPPVVVAKRIAATLRGWLAPGSSECVHENGRARPIRAGDVLILVRRRGPFFEAVIRALKEAGVPVAGADRLRLGEHIAVMDLVALGRACLLPDDDLTLACVLKSPLVGLDDDDLIALAPDRKGTLARALEASTEPRHAAAAVRLKQWRDLARSLSPFAFYARVLGADGGRRAMIGRLGPEAGDALDEFLREALAYEKDEPPSLTGFLARFEAADVEIKRDMEAASDTVRVMTVHASKGLEAKIVFLPDTCGVPSGKHDPKLYALEDAAGPPLIAWSKKKDSDPSRLAAARASAREAQEDEYRRLLYVAMTRAEERLYIAGFHGRNDPAQTCWYHMIRRALEPMGMIELPAPWDAEARILRRTTEPWPPRAPLAEAAAPVASAVAVPPWLRAPAPVERAPSPPISPSSALARADQLQLVAGAGGRPEAAFVGTLVHALLQHLPDVAAAGRQAAAERFLALRGGALAPERRAGIVAEVMGVLADPTLAPLFGPDARAEVNVAGKVARPGRAPIEIFGQIDRIVDTGSEVLIADFKTGTPKTGADVPESYVVQLALYRAALAPLWPGREIRAFLVWTAGPVVTELEVEAMEAALEKV